MFVFQNLKYEGICTISLVLTKKPFFQNLFSIKIFWLALLLAKSAATFRRLAKVHVWEETGSDQAKVMLY